jgi:phosphatidylserine/phosphatidylglycerophosphate/cardiolipin synthase-like enzyme
VAAVAFVALAIVAVRLVPRFLERPPPGPGPIEPRPTPATLAVAGLFVEPDDGRQPILEELAAARESISLIVYLLSDDEIIAALEDASARGITVRVMLEQHPFGGGGGQEKLFERLEAAGIQVRWSNPVFRFSHIKTFLIDNRVAIIMNLNLTRSAFTNNRELAVITNRPEDVAEAVAIFAADWEREGVPTPGSLVVSPTNSRQQLLDLIGRAQSSLDIYAEVVRDPEMLRAIIDAVERGVDVRLVMSGTAEDSNARDRAWLASSGVRVHVISDPYIHAKMFLADERELFVGSQNLTATSLDQNRELGIILTDAGSIERAGRVFDQDFQAGRPEGP